MFSIVSVHPQTDDHQAGVRLGYEKAVDLWIYEGSSYWQRYSAMLLAHSLIVAALVAVLTNGHYCSASRLRILAAALSVIGLVLTVAWYATAARAFAYYQYWIDSVKELEARMKGSIVTTQRGADFASGRPFFFWVRGERIIGHSPIGTARWSIRNQSRLVIALFAGLYLLTFLLTIRMFNGCGSVA
jgi:hypothetical protein